MSEPQLFLFFYLISVSAIGVILTIYDKIAAKVARRRRIPEAALLLFGALGGASLMYITMLIIRHKTCKPKFMAGFPIIILIHIVAAVVWLMF